MWEVKGSLEGDNVLLESIWTVQSDVGLHSGYMFMFISGSSSGVVENI